jgi:hypothetical protein
MKVVLTFLGVATIVSIVACSGGAGTASTLRGGPDGIPKSSTDAPGTGNESPGNSSQDQPGSSGQDTAGNCITCGGTYACTSNVTGGATQTQGDDTSFITLASATGGCVVSSGDTGDTDQSILLCGGELVDVQNGVTTVDGRWTGGAGGFSVTASAEGATVVVSCVPSNEAPQQTGGGTNTLDGG